MRKKFLLLICLSLAGMGLLYLAASSPRQILEDVLFMED